MKKQLNLMNNLLALFSRILQILLILTFIDAVFINSAILNWMDKISDSVSFLWFACGLPGRTISFFLAPFFGLWTLWFTIGQLFGIGLLLYLHRILFKTKPK